jgi:hypothetical protein
MQEEQKPISVSLMALQGHWLRADAVKQRMLTNVEQRGKGPQLPDARSLAPGLRRVISQTGYM